MKALPVKPIKPKRIADEVADQLTELIYRGFLKPGDRLPSERELARQLQVSRPTVREAINKLVVQGLVDQRHGQGTFVRSTEMADDNPMASLMEGQDVTLEHILEVRLSENSSVVHFLCGRKGGASNRARGVGLAMPSNPQIPPPVPSCHPTPSPNPSHQGRGTFRHPSWP